MGGVEKRVSRGGREVGGVGTLAVSEVRWLMATVVEGMAAASDPTVRVTRVMEAVLDRIGSIGGFMTLFELDPGAGVRMLRGIDLGKWEPRQRAARDAYFATPDHEEDPFLEAYARGGTLTEPRAAIRHELVSDAVWYGCEHVRVFRERAGMDSAIYVTVPAFEGEKGAMAGAGVFRGWSVCANRPWKAPAFTVAEKELLLTAFVGITPQLKGTWDPPVTTAEQKRAELPLRLRKCLACLMAGDSEKQVAAKLGLSQHTVHTYVKKLHAHFGVSSRSELLLKASGSMGG